MQKGEKTSALQQSVTKILKNLGFLLAFLNPLGKAGMTPKGPTFRGIYLSGSDFRVPCRLTSQVLIAH